MSVRTVAWLLFWVLPFRSVWGAGEVRQDARQTGEMGGSGGADRQGTSGPSRTTARRSSHGGRISQSTPPSDPLNRRSMCVPDGLGHLCGLYSGGAPDDGLIPQASASALRRFVERRQNQQSEGSTTTAKPAPADPALPLDEPLRPPPPLNPFSRRGRDARYGLRAVSEDRNLPPAAREATLARIEAEVIAKARPLQRRQHFCDLASWNGNVFPWESFYAEEGIVRRPEQADVVDSTGGPQSEKERGRAERESEGRGEREEERGRGGAAPEVLVEEEGTAGVDVVGSTGGPQSEKGRGQNERESEGEEERGSAAPEVLVGDDGTAGGNNHDEGMGQNLPQTARGDVRRPTLAHVLADIFGRYWTGTSAEGGVVSCAATAVEISSAGEGSRDEALVEQEMSRAPEQGGPLAEVFAGTSAPRGRRVEVDHDIITSAEGESHLLTTEGGGKSIWPFRSLSGEGRSPTVIGRAPPATGSNSPSCRIVACSSEIGVSTTGSEKKEQMFSRDPSTILVTGRGENLHDSSWSRQNPVASSSSFSGNAPTPAGDEIGGVFPTQCGGRNFQGTLFYKRDWVPGVVVPDSVFPCERERQKSLLPIGKSLSDVDVAEAASASSALRFRKRPTDVARSRGSTNGNVERLGKARDCGLLWWRGRADTRF